MSSFLSQFKPNLSNSTFKSFVLFNLINFILISRKSLTFLASIQSLKYFISLTHHSLLMIYILSPLKEMFSNSLIYCIAHYLFDLLTTLAFSALSAFIKMQFSFLYFYLQVFCFFFESVNHFTLVSYHLCSFVLLPTCECSS